MAAALSIATIPAEISAATQTNLNTVLDAILAASAELDAEQGDQNTAQC